MRIGSERLTACRRIGRFAADNTQFPSACFCELSRLPRICISSWAFHLVIHIIYSFHPYSPMKSMHRIRDHPHEKSKQKQHSKNSLHRRAAEYSSHGQKAVEFCSMINVCCVPHLAETTYSLIHLTQHETCLHAALSSPLPSHQFRAIGLHLPPIGHHPTDYQLFLGWATRPCISTSTRRLDPPVARKNQNNADAIAPSPIE